MTNITRMTDGRTINVPQGTKLTMAQMEHAHRVIVGGLVVKDRDGPITGDYDHRNGNAEPAAGNDRE